MAPAVSERVFKNFINGEWVESSGGKTHLNHNPANTHEIIGEFPLSTQADVDAAVSAARDAYLAWRLVPAPKRAEILFRVAELLLKRKDELSRDMTREMGKVLAETRGDVQEAVDMTYYMAGEGRRLFGQTTPSELPNKFAMSVRQSIGVCGMITPWNFPMAIPSWKMMPALVCGNTVVLKPAEDTPLSSYHLVEIMAEAGVPPGVVNLVSGDGPGAGAPLAKHKQVPVISFTGSTSTGRIIAETCAPDFKHYSLEWAAITSSWSWTTPTSTWPSMARSGEASGRAGNVAPPPAASECTNPSVRNLSAAWWNAPRNSKSATASIPASRWVRSSMNSNYKR